MFLNFLYFKIFDIWGLAYLGAAGSPRLANSESQHTTLLQFTFPMQTKPSKAHLHHPPPLLDSHKALAFHCPLIPGPGTSHLGIVPVPDCST